MSERAKAGDTISVHYTGRLNNGDVFDSSKGGEPLSFMVGAGQMIAGFDNGVLGMSVGEKKTITIVSEDAYGERIEGLIQEVPRESLRMDVEPEVGMGFYVQTPDGHQMPVAITAVTENNITLDANHPLAGQDLTFDIEVVSIESPK